MTRGEIIQAIHNRLLEDYPQEKVGAIMSSIEGQPAEWDVTWPYPQDDDFQALISDQFYPILALFHAVQNPEVRRP